MNFSTLLTDLWLVGRRKFQPRAIFKTNRPKAPGSSRVVARNQPDQLPLTDRDKKVDRLLKLLADAHSAGERGKITPQQLRDFRTKIDTEIQNA